MTCIHRFWTENYTEIVTISSIYIESKYAEDLVNDIALTIFEREDDKYEAMCERGELLWYIIRWIKICNFSKTTRFYYKYKKWQEHLTFEYPLNALGTMPDTYKEMNYKEQLENVETLLEDLYWFDAEIFKVYYLHNHSINTLTDATGISRKTIQVSLQKAKDYIKANIEKVQGSGRYNRKDNRSNGNKGDS